MRNRLRLIELLLLTKTVEEDAGIGRTVVAFAVLMLLQSLCYCPGLEVVNKLMSGSLPTCSSVIYSILFIPFLQQVRGIESNYVIYSCTFCLKPCTIGAAYLCLEC